MIEENGAPGEDRPSNSSAGMSSSSQSEEGATRGRPSGERQTASCPSFNDPFLNDLWKDPRRWEPVKSPDCVAGSRLCSKYGARFDVCVCDAIPIHSQVLSECARDCPFVTMEARDMPNHLKRNLLDWWYITNVYSICGKNNRKELPACLLWRIRAYYPNKRGKKYEGFKESNKI